MLTIQFVELRVLIILMSGLRICDLGLLCRLCRCGHALIGIGLIVGHWSRGHWSRPGGLFVGLIARAGASTRHGMKVLSRSGIKERSRVEKACARESSSASQAQHPSRKGGSNWRRKKDAVTACDKMAIWRGSRPPIAEGTTPPARQVSMKHTVERSSQTWS